jgi:hypothetical protein
MVKGQGDGVCSSIVALADRSPIGVGMTVRLFFASDIDLGHRNSTCSAKEYGSKMPSFPIRIVLFLSSYAPLFFIMAIKYGPSHLFFGGAMVTIAAVSVSLLMIYLNAAAKLAVDRVVVERISTKDAEAMGYIATYLIPFLDLKIDDIQNALSLLLLFFVLGVLYVHSNLIYVNPVLNLLNYHLFEVELEGGMPTALLSKKRFIERGTTMSVVSLGEQILLEASNAS